MVYNPWFDFSGDLIWIRNNVPLILRFIETTILGFTYFSSGEVDGIDGELSELYFFEVILKKKKLKKLKKLIDATGKKFGSK